MRARTPSSPARRIALGTLLAPFLAPLLAPLLIAAAPARALADADSIPFFHERFTVYGGGYFLFVDSSLKVNRDGMGQSIDLEDDLGLDESTTAPLAGLRWRFFKKHRIEAEFFPISRKARRTVDREIDLGGGNVIPIGADIAAGLDINAMRVNYGYSFIHDEKKELGIQVGLHLLEVDAGIDVDPQGSDPDFSINLGDDITAPLPNVGLYGGWAFTSRLAALARFQYFYVSINDVTGQLFQGDLGLEFHAFKHLDLGVGLRIFGLEGSGKDGGDKIEISQINYGPILYGALRF